MKVRLITPFLTCFLVLGLAGPLAAQDEERIYTRVALWQVDRARWSDFVEGFELYEQPVLEQLFEDGTIVEWGLDASSLHRPDGYTHSTWFSATSLAGLERVLDAYDAAMEAHGDEGTRALADFASMITKHRDYILRDLDRGSSGAQLDGGYWVGSFLSVEPGQGSEYRSWWDTHTKPLFEQLLADGTIVSYGLTVEDMITEGFGGRTSWYIVRNADALDTVRAAFRASWRDMTEEGRRARLQSLLATIEEGTFQEFMSELSHFAVKAN
jgi:hypothetical protein